MTEASEKIVMEHTAPVAETPMILHTEPEPKPEPQPEKPPREQQPEVTVTTTVKPPAEKPGKE